jgi:hypothetical protein
VNEIVSTIIVIITTTKKIDTNSDQITLIFCTIIGVTDAQMKSRTIKTLNDQFYWLGRKCKISFWYYPVLLNGGFGVICLHLNSLQKSIIGVDQKVTANSINKNKPMY